MTTAYLKDFAEACERIRGTTKKLEKISILAQYLSGLERDDLPKVCRFLAGHIFPKWSGREIYTGYSSLVSLIMEISGAASTIFNATYLKHGDLGSTAEELLLRKVMVPLIPAEPSILHIYATFDQMASITGVGSTEDRRRLLKGLILNCTPLEAKYLVKILTGELRIGLVEGQLEEALSKAFKHTLEDVKDTNLVTGDIGSTAILAWEGRLKDAKLEVMHPTNFMLANAMPSASEIAQYFKRQLYAEYKYDGVRAQLHKSGDCVRLFSRRLEDISNSFPEVAASAKGLHHDFILDGEIVPCNSGGPMPFQALQHRLRRKVLDAQTIGKVPVTYFAFDILHLDGRTLIKEPLTLRRSLLENVGLKAVIQYSHLSLAESADELQRLFDESKKMGYEGLVVKNPDSPYKPGRRGKHWVKLKKELDTLDVVVVAAEHGHGKRVGILSDYTFAVQDGDQLKVVGKAYSGLTDEEILQMTKVFKETTINDLGCKRIVKPTVVIEVAFDNVQQSERHDSGYALRFPRIKRIRFDKRVEDIDTLDRVREICQKQTRGSHKSSS